MNECEHDSYSETNKDSHFCNAGSTYYFMEFICDDCGEHVYEKYQYLGNYSREEIGEAWV